MKRITLKRTFVTLALTGLLVSFLQAADITSAKSGTWTDTSTWDSGTVPTLNDNVTIAVGHTVSYLIDAGATSVDLCKDITIEGTLQVSNKKNGGFTTSIYGKVVCNGLVELGQVGNNVTGALMVLKGAYTSITGTGSMSVRAINLNLTNPEPEDAHCVIDIPTLNISHTMSIAMKAKIVIAASSVVNMLATSTVSLALNGGQGAQIGELDIYGTLNAGTVVLRNNANGNEKSKLNVKSNGEFNVSQEFTPKATVGTDKVPLGSIGGSGVIFTVENGGALNWTAPATDPKSWTNPANAPDYDPNLEIIYRTGSFINGEETLETGNLNITEDANPIQFNALEKTITFNSKIDKIEVYNLLGARVYQRISPNQNIQLSNLSTGVYIIQATDTNSKVYNKKIIIN